MTERPIPAALAVVMKDSRFLLVRRSNRPDLGLWGFPGGKIELGETVSEAAVRELREETGIHAEARETLTSVDVIIRDREDRLLHHYVLVAVLCNYLGGEAVAADDVSEAAWFDYEKILASPEGKSPDVGRVAKEAVDRIGWAGAK